MVTPSGSIFVGLFEIPEVHISHHSVSSNISSFRIGDISNRNLRDLSHFSIHQLSVNLSIPPPCNFGNTFTCSTSQSFGIIPISVCLYPAFTSMRTPSFPDDGSLFLPIRSRARSSAAVGFVRSESSFTRWVRLWLTRSISPCTAASNAASHLSSTTSLDLDFAQFGIMGVGFGIQVGFGVLESSSSTRLPHHSTSTTPPVQTQHVASLRHPQSLSTTPPHSPYSPSPTRQTRLFPALLLFQLRQTGAHGFKSDASSCISTYSFP